MRIIHSNVPDDLRGSVAALGNFDGVHKGHQAVISDVCALAKSLNALPSAAVFTPHPRRVFNRDGAPFALMNKDQRDKALIKAGAQAVFHIGFDTALASMTPEEFIKHVLIDRLGLKAVVTGDDFCFGKGRSGNTAILAEIGAHYGLVAKTTCQISDTTSEEKISSSSIRQFLRDGQPESAAQLLTRPFCITGQVIIGDQRGRTIGFPTANISIGDYLRPKFGVYATQARLENGRTIPGVANLGRRPTVQGHTERLEVHLFDFAEDLYGQNLEIDLIHFIRPEQKFESFDALKNQIQIDSQTARIALKV